ncbi:hypothetical protein ACTFIW_003244 [Dictyostelium discoideum]
MIEPSDNLKVHLIGPSGCGKTSFINIVANNQLSNDEEGGGLNKLIAIIPTRFTRDVFGDFNAPEENEIDNPNVSKTNKCTPYSFPNGFTFVDSPPIGDTRKEREKINTETIIQSFIDLKSVNCVLMVINGTTPRLTYEIKDSFRRILESFPNSMVNNFVFLFTHCYQETSNFDIQELGVEKLIKPNQENIFYIKNPFFSQHPNTWNENAIGKLKREWVSCMETLGDIFSYIKTLPKVLTFDFKTINDSKDSVFTSLDKVFSQLQVHNQCNHALEKEHKKGKRTLLKEEKNKIKETISNEFDSIKSKLLEISQINTHLNIVNQLHSTLKDLQFQCRKMDYEDTRNLADLFINKLNLFIVAIEKEKSTVFYQSSDSSISVTNNSNYSEYKIQQNNSNNNNSCNPNVGYETKELQTQLQAQSQSQQHAIKNNDRHCYQGKQTNENPSQISYSMNCYDLNQQNQSRYFAQNPIQSSQHLVHSQINHILPQEQLRNQNQIFQPTQVGHTIYPYLSKHSNQTEFQIKERLKEIEIQKNKYLNEIFDLILEEKTLNIKLLNNQ